MRTLSLYFILLFVCQAHAAYNNEILHLSALGGTHTGGVYQSIGSIQPVGGFTAMGGDYIHYSGIAAGFLMKPLQSSHAIAHEWSYDNDQDGLNDLEEHYSGSNLNLADTDNDGLTDLHEQTHGGSPLMADTDSDGANDYDEYIAGTGMNNAESIFKLAYDEIEGGMRLLSWQGVLNRMYTLEYTSSLTDDWQSSPMEFAGADEAIRLIETHSTSSLFYRVQVRLID